jgi:ADP-ribose pyrophosphatase YjhB (NUDIX family)
MKKLIFKNAIEHNGHRCDVHHFDSIDFDKIPDELKLKTYAICFWNKKMLLVKHPQWDIWGIPGGTREKGESIENTLQREIKEETNCKTINYIPFSYQKIVSNKKDIYYRLYYKCNVLPLGKFKKDVGGLVNKIKWINPKDFEKYIEDKEFRRVVLQKVISL